MKRKKVYPKNGHITLESMSRATWYNNWTVKRFEKHLKGEILEIGCGIGSFTQTLPRYGSVHAIDIDEIGVRKTKLKTKEAKVGYGDIETGEYFFKNKKFDTIICINVLEHIKNDEKALSNISSLLKPKGTLILLIPAHPILYGAIDKAIGHYRRYIKREVIGMLKKTGLQVVLAKRMNFLGAFGWFISGRIMKEISLQEKKLKIFDRLAPFILPWEELVEPPFGTSFLIIAEKK